MLEGKICLHLAARCRRFFLLSSGTWRTVILIHEVCFNTCFALALGVRFPLRVRSRLLSDFEHRVVIDVNLAPPASRLRLAFRNS